MSDAQQMLTFFYAIFWGLSLNAARDLRAFDTHRFFRKGYNGYPFKRFIVGVIILDFFPILIFSLLFHLSKSIKSLNFYSIMFAGFASLSVFGWYRIAHAIIDTKCARSNFYSEKEHNNRNTDEKREERLDPNYFWPHFLGGVGYVAIFLFLAYLFLIHNS